MKKTLLVALSLATLTAAVAYTQREAITLAVIDKVLANRMQDPLANLPDGLHVALCGTGSPMPDPDRAPPCTLVIAGNNVLLFDAGSGAAKQISRMKLSTGLINHLFLTHFHSDHIDGLGEVFMTRWAQQTSGKRLQVHGPQGTGQVVEGFSQAYTADVSYRTAHHGEATMPPGLAGAQAQEFAVNKASLVPVLQEGDLEVKAFAVDHSPVEPAVGYHIRYKNRIVVISGDTKKAAVVAQVAQGADLLVHEALNGELVARVEQAAQQAQRPKLQKIFHDIPDYHTHPREVADLAQQAGVKAVVLTHIVPPLPLPTMKAMFLGDAPKRFKGTLRIGEDGDFISLPAGTDQILFQRRWAG